MLLHFCTLLLKATRHIDTVCPAMSGFLVRLLRYVIVECVVSCSLKDVAGAPVAKS